MEDADVSDVCSIGPSTLMPMMGDNDVPSTIAILTPQAPQATVPVPTSSTMHPKYNTCTLICYDDDDDTTWEDVCEDGSQTLALRGMLEGRQCMVNMCNWGRLISG